MALEALINLGKQHEQVGKLIEDLPLDQAARQILSEKSSKSMNMRMSGHARVLAQGKLQKNQRMLNSFMSLSVNPDSKAISTPGEGGIATPKWSLRKISDSRPAPNLKMFPMSTQTKVSPSHFRR